MKTKETLSRRSQQRMVRPFLLYHWSPVERRPQIQRRGLRPKALSRCGQWNAPYVCFSDSPSLAWILSAGMTDAPGEWDLWMVWSNVPSKLKRRTDLENGHGRPTEFRVHEPIPKSKLWHVGVRSHRPNMCALSRCPLKTTKTTQGARSKL